MSCETSFAPRRIDLRAYQRGFPDRARAYFRASGMSAVEIAVAFSVCERTAANWLEGVVTPRGAVVGAIALRDPDGFARHFLARAA